MTGIDDALQGTDDGRVHGLVEIGHVAVVAVDGHEVVDEVVRANAEKVALPCESVGDEGGGRGFHHNAEGNV